MERKSSCVSCKKSIIAAELRNGSCSKSPPHTGRVKVLLEMFPDAKFVHIVRDPLVIFPSTVHLWKTLYSSQGMQKPTFDGLEEYVLANLTRMYERFETDRELIPAENFCEIRYEDLVADPVREHPPEFTRSSAWGASTKRCRRLQDFVAGNQGIRNQQISRAGTRAASARSPSVGDATSSNMAIPRVTAGPRPDVCEPPNCDGAARSW